MPAFDVFMEAKNHNESASSKLKVFSNTGVQKFNFTPKNPIKVFGKYDLCVVVGSGNSRQGGGTLPHLIKTLRLKSILKQILNKQLGRSNKQL